MLTSATRRAVARKLAPWNHVLLLKHQATRAFHLSSSFLSTSDDKSGDDLPKIIAMREYKILKPLPKFVCGVGTNDKVRETSSSGISTSREIYYRRWYSMLYRCYSGKYPSYKGTVVCEEWLIFSNFRKWMKEQEKHIDLNNRQLDKDVLLPGSNVYSPETCHFVTPEVNCLHKSNSKSSKATGERMMTIASNMTKSYDDKVAVVLFVRGRAMVQNCAS